MNRHSARLYGNRSTPPDYVAGNHCFHWTKVLNAAEPEENLRPRLWARELMSLSLEQEVSESPTLNGLRLLRTSTVKPLVNYYHKPTTRSENFLPDESTTSDYVKGMSHELRTPLNVIIGICQFLERDRRTPLSPLH